jgi:hypothetical protein
LSSAPLFGRENCFPGKERVLYSPSHNYELTYTDREREEQPHHLFFRKNHEKEAHEFFEFYNQACVHWSPDERYFSISHFVGSNVAEDYIFGSNDIAHGVDIMDLLPQEVSNYFRKGILHGYVETLAWSKDGLFVRAFGNREDEPRTFDVTLKCVIQESRWTCSKTANK